jgi:hypothetical protein
MSSLVLLDDNGLKAGTPRTEREDYSNDEEDH